MEIITTLPKPNLILSRFEFSDISTIGHLNVDKGVFECNTLEDTVRRIKEPGKTAIPSGIYRVALYMSKKFGFVPHLLDVPYFSDILIHNGNNAEHTRGCILVGSYSEQQKNWIGESRTTLKGLMDVLEGMNQREELWLEISGGLSKDEMSL